MTFKAYLNEAVIVPPKLNIKTSDITKLNKQFKDTIINFVEYVEEDEMHAGYVPEEDVINVYISKNANHNTIEALVQHEIIHSLQDNRSGMRMAKSIEKEHKLQKDVIAKISKAKQDEIPGLLNDLEQLEVKRAFLNHEEEMAYAYMAVKLRKNDDINKTLKEFNEWWSNTTQTKLTNRFKKYYASYWLVRKEL